MPGLVLDAHASQHHTSIVQHLSQQKRSRLYHAVTHDKYRGEKAEAVNQYASREAEEDDTRNGDTPLNDQVKDKRWVAPGLVHDGHLIERQDELDGLTDFASPLTEAMVRAVHRKRDLKILRATFGAALTGQDGTTQTSFDSNNVVPITVGGNNTSLNVAKLRATRKILMAGEVDEDEELFMAITADEHDSLLGDVQVTSKDFNGGAPVLVEGKIMGFMGFTFLHTEQLTAANGFLNTNTRDCPAWAKSGMHVGTWEMINSDVAKRPDKRNNVQVYVREIMGATRTEEAKVVKVQTYVP